MSESPQTPPSRPSGARARLGLQQANVAMVGKLAVITALMFGFGYAMVPMYRHICAALGINVLSLGDRQIPGATSSIQPNTRVFFKGGNGQGAWPTQLEKLPPAAGG